MEYLQRFRLPLLVGGGTLIFIFVVYAALISPQGHKLSALHATEARLQSQQAHLQTEIVGLRHDKADFASNCAKLGTAVTEIPTTPDVSQFLQQVTNLAVATGNANTPSISVLQAPASPGTAGATPVQVSLSLNGNYGQMSSFIKGLDSFPRLFTITQLSVSGGPIAAGGGAIDPSTPNYTLTMTGAIYYSTGHQDVCSTSS
ncbi:MAG TPA: type 4a pilus biogenesis protein PilO [Acidimicrobiales bacterium]|nr:type 4a pilus biogenesis protein PilO [Acidimicrobiales bacterium]